MKIDKLKLFSKNINGQVSIMMAVLMIPLAGVIGAGLDWAQQVNTMSKMQSSVDSAILAVARATQLAKNISTADQKAIASSIISQNLSVSSNVTLDDFDITYVNNLLKITHTGKTKTNFLKMLNVPTLNIMVASELNMKFRSIDIALSVDLSGSMRGSKLSELKKATKILLDELEKAYVDEVRVSFIPWTRGVNVGAYYANLTKSVRSRHSSKRGTCLGTKPGGVLSPDDTTIKHPKYSAGNCPKAKLIPLTSVRKKDGINPGKDKLFLASKKWIASGGTGSNYGIYWAWATLEPTFFPVFGTTPPDNSDDLKKYAIIMTDGRNNKGKFDTDMLAACRAMKEKKITIYAIVLKTTSRSVLNTFKECATTNTQGRKYFIKTNDASGLSAVFQKIAQEVGQFYISK